MKKYLFVVFSLVMFMSVFSVYSQSKAIPGSIAIMPFDYPARFEQFLIDQIDVFFQKEMIEKGNNEYRIVERQKIDTIIREQRLQMSGLFSSTKISSVGSLSGASQIVLGQIIYADNASSTITIAIKVVDVVTGGITYTNLKESEIHLPAIRYWIEKIVDDYYGISEKSQQLESISTIDIMLPEVPPADKGVLVSVEEYAALQVKIDQYAQKSKYMKAINSLKNLLDLYKADSSNSFFKNNPEDMAYLRSINSWYNVSLQEIRNAYIETEAINAISLISSNRDDYINLMRNHYSSYDPEATNIRWNLVLDEIEKYDNAEDVFDHHLVKQTYGNVFHLRLIDDWKEYMRIRVTQKQDKKRVRDEQDRDEKRRKEEFQESVSKIKQFFFPVYWKNHYNLMSEFAVISSEFQISLSFDSQEWGFEVNRYVLYFLNPSILRIGVGTTLADFHRDKKYPSLDYNSLFPMIIIYPFLDNGRYRLNASFTYHWAVDLTPIYEIDIYGQSYLLSWLPISAGIKFCHAGSYYDEDSVYQDPASTFVIYVSAKWGSAWSH